MNGYDGKKSEYQTPCVSVFNLSEQDVIKTSASPMEWNTDWGTDSDGFEQNRDNTFLD